MDILCASQVTPSICLSMDEAVLSSCSSAVQLSTAIIPSLGTLKGSTQILHLTINYGRMEMGLQGSQNVRIIKRRRAGLREVHWNRQLILKIVMAARGLISSPLLVPQGISWATLVFSMRIRSWSSLGIRSLPRKPDSRYKTRSIRCFETHFLS